MKLLKKVFSLIRHKLDMFAFKSSESYWVERYRRGGDSGSGSYGELAQFKAEVINKFVETQDISTVIEFGCGDGNQLVLAKYPRYIGFDVSAEAIAQCRQKFLDDPSKSFYLIDEYQGQTAELSMSLDVIYHLVEDEVFEAYMRRLFYSSEKYVMVYSSNLSARLVSSPHVRHRQFTSWVEANLSDWALLEHIPNRYAHDPRLKSLAKADFFIYKKELNFNETSK